MITFCSSVVIKRPSEAIFHLLANVHLVEQAEGSPVLVLDLTTPGPPRLGSRYYEVVQMLPFYKGQIISEITAFEPPHLLEEAFTGPGMTGRLRYELTEVDEGTKLVQKQWFNYRGLLRILEPIIRRALIPRLEWRLGTIKSGLEQGIDEKL
jgi:hypothetical protein